MKLHHRNLIINTLAVLMFAISGFLVTLLVFYLYPRHIVEANTPMTTKQEYKIGEEVFVKGHTQIFITGTDTNDVRLQCGDTQYFIKQVSLTVRPTDTDYYFSLGVIPRQATASPPTCRFETTTIYTVKYFLGFTRTYTHIFTTNEFNIVDSDITQSL